MQEKAVSAVIPFRNLTTEVTREKKYYAGNLSVFSPDFSHSKVKRVSGLSKRYDDGRRKASAADPLDDAATIALVKQKLLESSPKQGKRNYLIFLVGINCGLRCSDLLDLRIEDVWNEESQSVIDKPRYIVHKLSREGKPRYANMYLNIYMKEAIKDYVLSLGDDCCGSDYLFSSAKRNCKSGGRLSTSSFYHILTKATKELALDAHVGTHTMRKTCGRHIYKNSGLDAARAALGHKSTETTLRYIGKTEDEVEETFMSMAML